MNSEIAVPAKVSKPAQKNPDQALQPAFELLADMPAEAIWLANFTSDNTKERYRHSVAEFITMLELRSMDDLYDATQAHIIAYREQLRDLGQSNSTIATKLSALSSLYKFLADRQLCPLNPVSGVKRPGSGSGGIGSGKTPALTRKQVRKLLEAPGTRSLKGLRDTAILYLFFTTGGRLSEPARLKVKDFKVHQGYWVIDYLVKGEKINRLAIAPIFEDSPTLFEYDQGYDCAEALFNYLRASGHNDDSEAPLFLALKKGNNAGENLSRQAFGNIFRQYVKKAGLPSNITPHSARATFITQCYEQEIPGEIIQRSAGHSSITTTEGYNQSRKKLSDSASLLVNYN
jgi:site-specific recombinase XerD